MFLRRRFCLPAQTKVVRLAALLHITGSEESSVWQRWFCSCCVCTERQRGRQKPLVIWLRTRLCVCVCVSTFSPLVPLYIMILCLNSSNASLKWILFTSGFMKKLQNTASSNGGIRNWEKARCQWSINESKSIICVQHAAPTCLKRCFARADAISHTDINRKEAWDKPKPWQDRGLFFIIHSSTFTCFPNKCYLDVHVCTSGRRLPSVGSKRGRKWQRWTSGETSGKRPGGFCRCTELRKHGRVLWLQPAVSTF